jgi:hypothetical protein
LIKKIGDLLVTDRQNSVLKLKDVLFVSGIKKNLFSADQLTSKTPYNVLFTDEGFVVFHRRTRKIIAQGDKKLNGYLFMTNANSQPFTTRDALFCCSI